jgi:hypothetical protein
VSRPGVTARVSQPDVSRDPWRETSGRAIVRGRSWQTTPKPKPTAPLPEGLLEAQVGAEMNEPTIYERFEITTTDLPAPGTIITGDDVDRWQHLLGPSIRWAIRRGGTIEVIDPRPVAEEPVRDEATERYHEMLGPLSEPFDLKGAGFTYTRYSAPDRLDDSWLYFPQSRRVRRLSTAQRSEGNFGSDIDLDSYGGFGANPAWFEFSLLGEKTILAPFYADHKPTKWGSKPADFLFQDTWEPRETWIVGARSKIPGYNFSLRVIYIDAETFLIPYTEVYDHDGQLWRSYIQQWDGDGEKPRPDDPDPKWDFKSSTVLSLMVFDMQIGHTTRCQFPLQSIPNKPA